MNDLSVVINVTASGIAYKKKQFVHVGNTDHTLLFGEIILMLCDSEQNVFFVVKVKNFVQTHMRTYTLQSNDKSSSIQCVAQNDLRSKYPLYDYRGHIIPKYIMRKD